MIVGKEYTIDLLNLYDWLAGDQLSDAAAGRVTTDYNNTLEMDDDEHVDLYLPAHAALSAMDGETVRIEDIDGDKVTVQDLEDDAPPFILSIVEAEMAGLDED